MKTKKNSRESSSSSSSSSSDDDSGSEKSRSRSKSKSSSDKKENSSLDSKNKKKQESKSGRTPQRDVKSKWDSPDDRLDKKRLINERSDQDKTRESREQSESEETRVKRSAGNKSTSTEQQHNNSSSSRQTTDNRRHDNRFDRYERNNRSNHDHHNRDRSREQRNRSRSPQRYRSNDRRRRRSRSKSFDHSKAVWGKAEHNQRKSNEPPKEKEKPNFGLSGKLTEETNTYKGVVIKYSEPPEARKPKRRWRLYPFKGEKAMQTLYIHRESAYLIGRDRKVVDLPVDHPSCSKQHAALQYRLVPFTRDDGSVGKRVRPYLIDLESANGTFINNKQIDSKKYIELLERDVIKFGFSSREYVLLHENSKDEAQDDDVNDELERERKDEPERDQQVKTEA